MIDYSAKQGELLASLITQAARRAHDILKPATGMVEIRRVDADGVSMIGRLQRSPCADDQILALFLRDASLLEGRNSEEKIARVFGLPVSSLEIEALRRAVMATIGDGCVTTAVDVAVDRLCRAADACHINARSTYFRSQADLYADLWCDPRIGAALGARRIMLAMVTRLHELSHDAALMERT